MEVAWRDPLTGYGAQSAAQLDARLGRWVNQTPMDATSLRILTTYQQLAYQLSHYHQFQQKHQFYDNE